MTLFLRKLSLPKQSGVQTNRTQQFANKLTRYHLFVTVLVTYITRYHLRYHCVSEVTLTQ